MTRFAMMILVSLACSGCQGAVDTLFYPDFDDQPAARSEPPQPATALQGQSTATTAPASRPSSLPTAAQSPTSRGVEFYYQRQLEAQRRGLPSAAMAPEPTAEPTRTPKPATSSAWYDRLFTGGPSRPVASSATPPNCYRGQLTSEGATCQAFRAESGELLSLAGSLRGFGSGDRVCVCGRIAKNRFCRQGTTIYVAEIAETCPAER